MKMISKKDIGIIGVILLIGFSVLAIRYFSDMNLLDSANVYAEITFGQAVETVSLDYNQVFSVFDIPNVVFEVSDGEIAFIKSDCPDQVCVNVGFIRRPGQMAACLPHGLIMFLVSGDLPDDATDNGFNDLDLFLN